MSRRKRAVERKIQPDPRYGDIMASKFINNLTKDGKKALAENIFYSALQILETKAEKPALEVFQKAVKNVMPMLEVKSRRVGGATYQVPMEVPGKRKQALAIRWLIGSAKARHEKTDTNKLQRNYQNHQGNKQ